MTYHEWCIAQSITRFPKESWYRYADRLEGSDKIIRANFMHPRGTPLDVQAADMNIDIEAIVDFVYKYRYVPCGDYDEYPAEDRPNQPGHE